MLSDDMHENLRMYYAWARINCPSDLYYPHEIPTRRLQGRQIGPAGLTDDEAMHINRALCALREANPEALKVVEDHIADDKSLRWLEERRGHDRKRLGRLLSEACSFVSGYLVAAA